MCVVGYDRGVARVRDYCGTVCGGVIRKRGEDSVYSRTAVGTYTYCCMMNMHNLDERHLPILSDILLGLFTFLVCASQRKVFLRNGVRVVW